MGFTIGAAFDLLFAPEPHADSGWDGRYEGYESRRWFRRPVLGPSPPVPEVLAEVADAEEILARKVAASVPAWREANGFGAQVPTSPGEVGESEPAAGASGESAEGSAALEMAEPETISVDRVRHVPPRMPYDVFAIAAYLVEGAGVYHHLQPVKRPPGQPGGGPGIRHMEILPSDRAKVLEAAEGWSNLDPAKS